MSQLSTSAGVSVCGPAEVRVLMYSAYEMDLASIEGKGLVCLLCTEVDL